MTAKVISFINMKGGVGKTTLCLEIANFLANKKSEHSEKNYRVLLIDIDPQANLTQALNEHYFPQKEKFDKSIEVIFNKKPEGFNPGDVIVQLEKNIDLIPGELETIFLERSSGNSTSQKLLDFIIDYKIRNNYDFIMIDCPPTYSIYTETALFISDYYFVPVIPDKYSTLGVDLLERVVHDIVDNNRNSVFKNRSPKNMGIIFTRVSDEKPKQKIYMSALRKSDIVKQNELTVFDDKQNFKEYNKLSTFELGKFVTDTNDHRLKEMVDRIGKKIS
ncbi:ParA family protein [Liquorilactobacillus mali]|uniref:ParA family protein n=1 Tax=Liquorilactobacillus mali TaxID=1618 RepID=UPI0002491453|nr:AAA family ATPase [Liquorilactobacillus mali]